MRYGTLSRHLAALAGPILVETVLIMMLGAVDTFMLSRHSDDSVAAVGVVNQLINFVLLIFEVISIGTSILCSQYIGAGLRNKVVQVVGISLVFNLASGLFFSFILYRFAGPVLGMMGLRAELLPEGLSYMKIVGGFAFLQALSLAISAALRSADKAVYPMAVSAAVNVLNIFGNYTLIFGKFGMPALGVTGAALSTVICRGVSVVLLFILLRKKHIRHFPKELFSPFPWRELGNLLKIGIPSAGEHISYSLSQIVITYFINMMGNAALATRSYCQNVVMFGYVFSLAVAQGGAIVIGHLVGMRKTRAAFVLGKRILRVVVTASFSFALIMALCGRFLLSFLTSNPEIIAAGCAVLWVDVLVETGRAMNFFGVQSLRAAGDIYFPVTVGIVVCWTVSVGFSYIFGIAMAGGIAALWCAFFLDENVRGLIFIKRWNGMKWTSKSFVSEVPAGEADLRPDTE